MTNVEKETKAIELSGFLNELCAGQTHDLLDVLGPVLSTILALEVVRLGLKHPADVEYVSTYLGHVSGTVEDRARLIREAAEAEDGW